MKRATHDPSVTISKAAKILVSINPTLEDLPSGIKEAVERKLLTLLSKRLGSPILPEKGQRVAVDFKAPKTAALFFDRIWNPPVLADPAPKEIAVYGATELEVLSAAILLACETEIFRKHQDVVWDRIQKRVLSRPSMKNGATMPASRSIALALRKSYALHVFPIFDSVESMERQYGAGRKEVLLGAIRAIPLVREEKLTWEQVVEVRNDTDARKKLRNMIHWMDTAMSGKSAAYIRDEIEQRLEEYSWALKKHSIDSVLGTLSSLLDPKFVASAGATAAGLFLVGEPFLAAAGAASLAFGKAAISLAKTRLGVLAIERESFPELAYVHEIQRRMK